MDAKEAIDTPRTEKTTQKSSDLNIEGQLSIDSGRDLTIAGSNINAGEM